MKRVMVGKYRKFFDQLVFLCCICYRQRHFLLPPSVPFNGSYRVLKHSVKTQQEQSKRRERILCDKWELRRGLKRLSKHLFKYLEIYNVIISKSRLLNRATKDVKQFLYISFLESSPLENIIYVIKALTSRTSCCHSAVVEKTVNPINVSSGGKNSRRKEGTGVWGFQLSRDRMKICLEELKHYTSKIFNNFETPASNFLGSCVLEIGVAS